MLVRVAAANELEQRKLFSFYNQPVPLLAFFFYIIPLEVIFSLLILSFLLSSILFSALETPVSFLSTMNPIEISKPTHIQHSTAAHLNQTSAHCWVASSVKACASIRRNVETLLPQHVHNSQHHPLTNSEQNRQGLQEEALAVESR